MIDLQSSQGHSPFHLEEVGVKALKYPIFIEDAASGECQRVVATWSLSADLKAEARGTHMSRFLGELQTATANPFSLDQALALAERMRERQGAARAQVRCRFEWTQVVLAPISRVPSVAVYRIAFQAESGPRARKLLQLNIPATSLCPCSKAISDRGAHNQRTMIQLRISFAPNTPVPAFQELISLLEGAASAPVYPLLKRDDEKFLTEYAYDHPAFVEDLIRGVAARLTNGLAEFKSASVEVVNMESIHAHDCYAKLRLRPNPPA